MNLLTTSRGRYCSICGGQFMTAASDVVARLCLSMLLALLAVPGLMLAGLNACSAALPHDHILLNGADTGDLQLHLQAEVSCGVHISPGDAIGGLRRVVSILRAAPRSIPGSISIQNLLAVHSPLRALPHSATLSGWWAAQSLANARPTSSSPFKPPPRTS